MSERCRGSNNQKGEGNPRIRNRDNYDTDARRTNFDFMSSAIFLYLISI